MTTSTMTTVGTPARTKPKKASPGIVHWREPAPKKGFGMVIAAVTLTAVAVMATCVAMQGEPKEIVTKRNTAMAGSKAVALPTAVNRTAYSRVTTYENLDRGACIALVSAIQGSRQTIVIGSERGVVEIAAESSQATRREACASYAQTVVVTQEQAPAIHTGG